LHRVDCFNSTSKRFKGAFLAATRLEPRSPPEDEQIILNFIEQNKDKMDAVYEVYNMRQANRYWISDSLKHHLGYEKDSFVLEKHSFALIHPEDLDEFIRNFFGFIKGYIQEKAVTFVFRMKLADGGFRQVKQTCQVCGDYLLKKCEVVPLVSFAEDKRTISQPTPRSNDQGDLRGFGGPDFGGEIPSLSQSHLYALTESHVKPTRSRKRSFSGANRSELSLTRPIDSKTAPFKRQQVHNPNQVHWQQHVITQADAHSIHSALSYNRSHQSRGSTVPKGSACIECRRRKLKCGWIGPGSACYQCTIRKSICIRQSNKVFHNPLIR